MPICVVCSYQKKGLRFDRVSFPVQPENIRTSGLTGPDVCFCFFLRGYLTKKCEKRADSVLKTGGGTAIMIDAGYNYERLAGKMAWPGIAPQSIRHILITHQDTDWKTSRFRRCRKRCKGIRGSAVTLGSDHVQCVLQCADNGGGMAYKSSSVFR